VDGALTPESQRPTLLGSRWAVSAGHPLVADAAARVFERGGNAIDAGVAAGLAANVVQADMCNFGGVAPIIVRAAGSDEVHSIEGLGWWSEEVTVEAYRERHGDDMPLGGAVAVVPAAPAAWLAALSRFGTLTFAEVAAPAIELARDGFPLDMRLAASLASIPAWASSRAIFWPDGLPPRPGGVLRQPDLAALLEGLAAAEHGASREDAIEQVRREFYEGDPARRIVEFVTGDGGWMTLADLAEFRADIVPAIGRRFGDHDVFVGDTWCQGPALLQALAILEHVDLPAHNSPDYIHTVAEAIKLAFWDREHHYGDPRHVDVDLERLLSAEHAAAQAGRIGPVALTVGELDPGAAPVPRDTTYLCTIDAAGNSFSATISDTPTFGPVVPGLGILASPRGVQSRLDPGHPAAVGPRRRPRLTPSPALAVRDDGALVVFGCPGGDAILQAMLQAFLNLTRFQMTPQQALEAPRFVSWSFPNSFHPHQTLPGRLAVEERVEAATRTALADRGHDVEVWPSLEFDAGSVGLVLDFDAPRDGDRVLAAAADPRRIGYAQAR
jgi:gamma-glutamyltranspeptidase / glutathione hydrolase